MIPEQHRYPHTLPSSRLTPHPAMADPWVMGTSWRIGWSCMGRDTTISLLSSAGLREETVNFFFSLPPPPSFGSQSPLSSSEKDPEHTVGRNFTHPFLTCPSIFLCHSDYAVLERMLLCPWSAAIPSSGLESSSGAFCSKRLLPQPAYPQLFHESGSVLQNKSVSLPPFCPLKLLMLGQLGFS